ncbi:MAG: PQQ-binding-like beta-propeller repeat protein, partial [Thaumarchaeota archaeon]|nr:PQQ-binding-like beta-propeller repeat protein [Nitrososphaerota archaeon]
MQQVQNMTGAQIFYPGPAYNNGGTIPGSAVVDLKTLSTSALNATLYNDWGYANQTPACAAADGGGSPGATGAGWGAPWVLGSGTTAGIAYINTGNRGPYTSPCNPGPDLWSSAVMALNETNGNWIWGFQTSAHDVWDYDCAWNQALGNETVNGANTPVLWKTCKNGYLYELNALNGKMIWAWSPTQNILARCQYCYMHNPMNTTEMTEAFFNPSLANTLMYPQASAGFEMDFSYSPTLNYIFTASQNVPGYEHYIQLNSTNYGKTNGFSGIAIAATAKVNDNATIEAVNAATGQMVWSHLIAPAGQGFRGGLTNSGNVVYVPLASGDVQMLNAATGALLDDVLIGGPVQVLPAIGATSTGQPLVLLSIDTGIGS